MLWILLCVRISEFGNACITTIDTDGADSKSSPKTNIKMSNKHLKNFM